MSAPKHTPTPWVRGEPEGNDALATIRTADGETVIAEVYFVEGHGTREEAEGDLAHMLAATELADALEAALLFHRGGPWTDDDAQRWRLLTGHSDATTKALCDCIRARLRAAGRIP